ncbi:MAG: hypothetical protein IIC49_04785, partial [Planctomycetes bacterium]|nr:hypothetical protein [Planctomycetota bacterium]
MGELNTASKEWVIRQYDHEVQGRSVVKPLCGPGNGPSDAAVVRPRYDSHRGIAIGCGMSLDLADVDPYLMAVAAIDEALRNVICVGADPLRIAILDNFCWGRTDDPQQLGGLVRAAQAEGGDQSILFRAEDDQRVASPHPVVQRADFGGQILPAPADEALRQGIEDQHHTALVQAVEVPLPAPHGAA